MSPAEIAAVGLERVSVAQPSARAIAREFETMFLKLLWETARAPAGRSQGAPGGMAGAVFADVFAHELAARHGLGFGDMVLRALDELEQGGKAHERQR